ncbi:hypothetical protein AAZV13_19G065700 [Glycine max]
MNILRSFWNSPTDLKTTHFWDPAFNWSLPFAAAMDTKKPPETISVNMTGVMCVYSALCVRGLLGWYVRLTHIFLYAMPPMRQCNCINSQDGSELKGN